jgi:hypothetical protein
MNFLVCGGTFDSTRGKSSKIVSSIASSLSSDFAVTLINGGNYNTLKCINFTPYDLIFWFPNISNDEEKLISSIKEKNPHAFLISSKRVVEKSYTEFDVITRLLKTRSNLGVMITTDANSVYHFNLLDPLGNTFYNGTSVDELSAALIYRIKYIKSLSRIQSVSIGKFRPFAIDASFIEFVKYSASEFSKYVNAVNPSRMLGNASTRCMLGFPATKQNNKIFVTQRNIDKTEINASNFVEVTSNEDIVEYYGTKKPSVDTPIQIRLFNYYRNINFMVHGHVYVNDAPFTEHTIPCGYIEEFNEIVALYPDCNATSVAVNLKGHGHIIMAATVHELQLLGKYCSREFPESSI